jgi:hypothetical protein
MKKLSLVLLICLCACGQGAPSRKSLFNEALGTVGKSPPSGWIENDGSYWKSLDLSVGKDWIVLQVDGNIVEQAIVGCLFANAGAQTKWLKESYDTLIADKWALLSDDGGAWVLMNGDKVVSGVTSEDNGSISAAVSFMSVSTAVDGNTATGGATKSPTWTAVDVSGIFTNGQYDYISAIAYGNGRFVAVSDGGTMAYLADN